MLNRNNNNALTKKQRLIEFFIYATSITRHRNLRFTLFYSASEDADALCEFYNKHKDYGQNGLYREGNRVYLTESQVNLLFESSVFSECLPDGEIQIWQNNLFDFVTKNKMPSKSPAKLNELDQARILQDSRNVLTLAAKNSDPTYLNYMMRNFSPEVFALALTKPFDNKIPMDFAIIHQSSGLLMYMMENIHCNDAIVNHINNGKKPLTLHYAARYQSREVFDALFKPISYDDLHPYLLTKDETGLTLFESILLKYNHYVALELLEKISSVSTDKFYQIAMAHLELIILIILTQVRWHTIFDMLFNKMGESFLIQIVKLAIKHNLAHSSLTKLILCLQPREPEVLTLQNWIKDNREKAILDFAQETKDDDMFYSSKKTNLNPDDPDIKQLIWRDGFRSVQDLQEAYFHFKEEKDNDAIALLDTLYTNNMAFTGVTLAYEKRQAFLANPKQDRLHRLIIKAPADAAVIIEALTEKELEEEVLKKDANDNTVFKIAAKKLDANAFALLFNKISAEIMHKALIIANKNGDNAFHDMAVYQSSETFMNVYKKVHIRWHNNALEREEALMKANVNEATPIHLVAYYQPATTLIFLLESLEKISILYTLALQGSNSNSTLLIAMARHHSEDIIKLLNLLCYKTISIERRGIFKSTNRDGKTLLEQALIHQSPTVVVKIIELLAQHESNHDTLSSQLHTIFNKNEHIKLRLIHSLLTNENWQTWAESILEPILLTIGNLLMPYLVEANLYGTLSIHISKLIRSYSKRDQTPLVQDTKPASQLFYARLFSPFASIETDQKPELTIYSSQNNRLDPARPNFLNTLLREGVRTLSDYHALQKIALTHPGLSSTLIRLVQSNCLFTGSLQPISPESNSSTSLVEVHNLMTQDNALLQWIPENQWKPLLNQLNRQEEKKEEKPFTHQFNHEDGTIIPYKQLDAEAISSHPVQYAKAFDLANGLNTNVMSYDEKPAPHVGILYDRSLCEVKAMFTSEIEIKDQEWLGSEEQVKAYAEKIKPVHCINRETFKKHLQESSYKVSFVFANLAPEAALAVILSDNTLAGRVYAMNIARDFHTTFKRALPIVFYYYIYRSIRMYLPEEQAADNLEHTQGIKMDPFAEREAKCRLFALQADIISHDAWINKRLLLSPKESDKMPTEANAIVNLIQEEAKSALPFWSKTAKNVAKQLKKLGDSDNENKAFFNEERKKYFK